MFILRLSFSQTVHFVRNGDDSGPGSLRQILADAASADTIKFFPEVDTVFLTTDELLIDRSLVISGNPPYTSITKQDTLPKFRIFRIQSLDSLMVLMKYLSISGGNAADGNDSGIHGQHGGGIFVPDSIHELILENCLLYNNQSGAGYHKGGVSKTGNGGHGGGIYSLSKLTLENCVLLQNLCGPGANASSGGDWSSQDAGNGGSGGGIFCLHDLVISGCTFSQNQGGDGGDAFGGGHSSGGDGGSGGSAGAIYCKNSEVLIFSTLVDYNSSGKGGNASNISTYCDAGYAGSGGALVLDNCSSNLTNAIFVNNLTGRGGGGGGNPSGSPTDGGPGGAIFVRGGQFSCHSCAFRFNITGKGGGSTANWSELESYGDSGEGAGIYLDTAEFIIHNSSFTGNYTTKGDYVGYLFSGGSGGNGGGILITRLGSPSMISNCLFEENHTGDGIMVKDMDELKVISGANGGNGGGIYIRKSASVLCIIGCVFKSNYCGNSVIPSGLTVPSHYYIIPNGGSGGAVCNAGGNVRIINSTITGNYCGTVTIYNSDSLNLIPFDSLRGKGGGLYGINEVINSIIADNSIGNEFPNDLEGSGSVNYSLITDDTLAEYSGTGNLIKVNPGFQNFPEDLSLAQNSLAINHGSTDTTGLFLPETDIAENPRLYGERIDMGAYEFQGEPLAQFVISTYEIIMDSIVAGAYAVDSLSIFNYGAMPLTISAIQTNAPFALSLDKTNWTNSLDGVDVPAGAPFSTLRVFVKFEGLANGFFADSILISVGNSFSIISVSGYCKSTEGIIENDGKISLSISPNPFNNKAMISFNLEESGDVNLSVYNSSGLKVDEIVFQNQLKGPNSFIYQNNGLLPGIYFLKIDDRIKTGAGKLIILSY